MIYSFLVLRKGHSMTIVLSVLIGVSVVLLLASAFLFIVSVAKNPVVPWWYKRDMGWKVVGLVSLVSLATAFAYGEPLLFGGMLLISSFAVFALVQWISFITLAQTLPALAERSERSKKQVLGD